MKIRHQNSLIIIPVFLVVYVLLFVIAYNMHQREFEWGIEKTAVAISDSIISMIDKSDFDKINSSQKISYNSKTAIALRKVLKWEQIVNVGFLNLNSQHMFWLADEDKYLLGDLSLLDKLKTTKTIHSEVIKKNDDSVINVFSKINPNIALYYQFNVNSLNGLTKNFYYKMISLLGLTIILALIVSEIISFFISREIKMIGQNNDYSTIEKSEVANIKEIVDLNNTINTMDDILKALVDKTKNAFIQNEQFRSKEELFERFKQEYFPEKYYVNGNWKIYLNKIDSNKLKTISFVVEKDSSMLLISIIPTKLNKIDDYLLVAGLKDVFSAHITKNNIKKSYLQKIILDYQLDILQIVHIDCHKNVFAKYKYDQRGDIKKTGKLKERMVWGIFPEDIQQKIDFISETYTELNEDEYIKNMKLYLQQNISSMYFITVKK